MAQLKRPLVVINVAGLTPALLTRQLTPHLFSLQERGFSCPLKPVFPAVTCSAQSTMLTGLLPRDHGVVGNGWFFRELGEVWLWRQSNRLVSGRKLWEEARLRLGGAPARGSVAGFTAANLFWWFAMGSSAEIQVTPRPVYPADGRKLPDIYATPPGLRDELVEKLGPFPLFNFWGPAANILSSRWIAEAAGEIIRTRRPSLTLVYLPHLDYDLQRFGPQDARLPAQVRAVDAEAGKIIAAADQAGAQVVALSEYGITAVRGGVHLNRALRQAGLLRVQEIEQDGRRRELLDPQESSAFALADHQVAHVYVRDPQDIPLVRETLTRQDGVERLLEAPGKKALGLDHPRAGELVAISAPDRWFTYYYWLDAARAPDFARTVDIHRKPGYDPLELFLDPKKKLLKARVAWTLLKKILGFRYLLEVVPLDAALVRGSHGRLPQRPEEGPVFVSGAPEGQREFMEMTEVREALLSLLV